MIHPFTSQFFPQTSGTKTMVFAVPPQWDCRGCPGFRDPSAPSMDISQVYGGPVDVGHYLVDLGTAINTGLLKQPSFEFQGNQHGNRIVEHKCIVSRCIQSQYLP